MPPSLTAITTTTKKWNTRSHPLENGFGDNLASCFQTRAGDRRGTQMVYPSKDNRSWTQRKQLTFKLPGQEVAQPSLQQRGDATHEKQPYSPASSPEATARALPYRAL